MSELELGPGAIIGGSYEVQGRLGAGGMGVVLEARHRRLGRRVAVKLLHAKLSDDPGFRARFDREAKVMSRLNHPNAVRVFDYGQHEGALFIVMEFLEGHALEREVGAGPMDEARALEIGLQVCDVLTVTHEMGLVHRDIKPENIFITDTPEGPHATLVDFGLAFIERDEELSRMTREGQVSGTPQFLSPEQARGQRDIGPASDIYSLGCVLYELLSGESAVPAGALVEMLNAHLYVPAQSMRVRAPEADVSAEIDNFVLSMLAKEAEGRPSALEASTTLRKYLASDEMRGRGRPARLLRPRSYRAVTATAGRAPTLPAGERALDDFHGCMAFVGGVPREWAVAAGAAGWRAVGWQAGVEADVLVALDSTRLTPQAVAACPTIAVVGEASIDRAVELLKLGVEDVAVEGSPEEILRKARRLYESIRRRGAR